MLGDPSPIARPDRSRDQRRKHRTPVDEEILPPALLLCLLGRRKQPPDGPVFYLVGHGADEAFDPFLFLIWEGFHQRPIFRKKGKGNLWMGKSNRFNSADHLR